MKKRKTFSGIYVTVLTIITYVPILLTVIYSFNESKSSVSWTGFSWKWYEELLLGTMGAIGIWKMSEKPEQYKGFQKINNIMSYITMLPIMIHEIILGMVFLAVFSFMDLPFGMLTLIIAHTTFCVPYIFSMVKARLVGMDKSLAEAALDMGASPFQVFRDITLPLIMPAVLSGTMLAFAMSFDDVVISIFVTGAKVNTLPVKIYTKLKTGVTPEINALATVMLLVTLILLGISSILSRKWKRQ